MSLACHCFFCQNHTEVSVSCLRHGSLSLFCCSVYKPSPPVPPQRQIPGLSCLCPQPGTVFRLSTRDVTACCHSYRDVGTSSLCDDDAISSLYRRNCDRSTHGRRHRRPSFFPPCARAGVFWEENRVTCEVKWTEAEKINLQDFALVCV